ncbi:diacylglycerol O-acyltransferase 3-like [Phoenix dactylifera]|uniref:Diacylglycerol O-acyltransferase 3-like n=1 Tax=Phoenix dactylifera TaxID=42345 RepID=A0A8B8ZZ86_PHODC|nr:diacylglycerol O-acyltransferase 3-like [Phoenix dactylifera]
MEATGAAFCRSPAFSGARVRRGDARDPLFSGVRRNFRISALPRGLSGSCGGKFFDEGHLKYYVSPARCDARKKEGKRRAKLVKVLVRDLSAFYSMGFGVEAGDGLASEVKGKMISEAAELLLTQLKQLRAQEKEMKRKRKEKKAAKKAAKMKDCADDSTSSSSSESSDSECESVVKMRSLTTAAIPEPKTDALTGPSVTSYCKSTPLPLKLSKTGEGIEENSCTLKLGAECNNTSATSRSSASCSCCSNSISLVDRPMDRIEVCMGGKCKKSGALQLLEEFEKKIGIEGAVVGCKCMGKCRDGPNVRVISHCTDEDNVKDVKNPLCIGVGLDDVGTVVAKFFGEKKGIGLVTA